MGEIAKLLGVIVTVKVNYFSNRFLLILVKNFCVSCMNVRNHVCAPVKVI